MLRAMNQQPGRIPPPASYQDVLDAPPNMIAEIVRGESHLYPRPASRHARATSALNGEVCGPSDRGRGGPEGWQILVVPELNLGEDALAPDRVGWRRERMEALPETAWFDLAPDWSCEVPSPGTRRLDLTDKRAAYAAAGVPRLWFVDPIARALEAFALREGAWTLVAALAGEAEARVPPFDAAAFPLEALCSE